MDAKKEVITKEGHYRCDGIQTFPADASCPCRLFITRAHLKGAIAVRRVRSFPAEIQYYVLSISSFLNARAFSKIPGSRGAAAGRTKSEIELFSRPIPITVLPHRTMSAPKEQIPALRSMTNI